MYCCRELIYNIWILLVTSHLPKKSARTERAPIQRPPKAAAVGMYRFNSWIIDCSLCPLITICWSFSCLATYIKQRWRLYYHSLRFLVFKILYDRLTPLYYMHKISRIYLRICRNYSRIFLATVYVRCLISICWIEHSSNSPMTAISLITWLTSLALEPDTSIQVLEKKAQDPSMKTI